jgi:hypothetical protein
MYQKFQKCLLEMNTPDRSPPFADWREKDWKITDIKNFINAYSTVTEECARSVGV